MKLSAKLKLSRKLIFDYWQSIHCSKIIEKVDAFVILAFEIKQVFGGVRFLIRQNIERGREERSRARTGNFPSEIWHGRSIFARGTINIPGGGGESIHCFGETRRARVPAHRSAGRRKSFGGSMRYCIATAAAASALFSSLSRSRSFSRTLDFSYTRYVYMYAAHFVFCSQYFRTHALTVRTRVRSRGMIREGRIIFAARRLDVNNHVKFR